MNKFKEAKSIKTYLEKNFEILSNYSKFQESDLAKEIRKNAEEVNIFAFNNYIAHLEYDNLKAVKDTCISIFEYYCKNCKLSYLELIELYKDNWNALSALFNAAFDKRPVSTKNSPILDFIGFLPEEEEILEEEIDKLYNILFRTNNNVFILKALITNNKVFFERTVSLMTFLAKETKYDSEAEVINLVFTNIEDSYYLYYKKEMLNMLSTSTFNHILWKFDIQSYTPLEPVRSKDLRLINLTLQHILFCYRFDGETLLSIFNIFYSKATLSSIRFVVLLVGAVEYGSDGQLNMMDEVFAEIAHTIKEKDKFSYYFEEVCHKLVSHGVKRMMNLDALNGSSHSEKGIIMAVLKMGFMSCIFNERNFFNYIDKLKLPCSIYNSSEVGKQYYGIDSNLSYQIIINLLDFYNINAELPMTVEDILKELEIPVEKLQPYSIPVRLNSLLKITQEQPEHIRKYYSKKYINTMDRNDYINHLADCINKTNNISCRDLRRYGREFISTFKFTENIKLSFYDYKFLMLKEIIEKTNNPIAVNEEEFVIDTFYEGILQSLFINKSSDSIKTDFIEKLTQLAWETKTYNELSRVLKLQEYYTGYTFSK